MLADDVHLPTFSYETGAEVLEEGLAAASGRLHECGIDQEDAHGGSTQPEGIRTPTLAFTYP